ncbi:MAG: hypothetical protein ACT4OK_16075 [Gemmobacter sp.]
MFRTSLVALLIAASTPVLAFDLPHLTFPEAPVATTSTANGK